MSAESQGTPGERPSFDEVYRNEFSWVWNRLHRMGVPKRMVQDATQDVFVVVQRRLPEYQPRDRLRGWLGAIAWNVAARLRGRKSYSQEIPDAEPEGADDDFDLLDELASAEQVRRVLDAVPPFLAALFILHHFDGVTAPELAKHFDTNLNTMKKRLWIARREVRAAWLEVQERDAAQPDVVPLVGPLTFIEAGRQVPEVPEDARARVWEGLEERIGGGGPGSRSPGPIAPRRTLVPARPAARWARDLLLATGGMAVGVGGGALWDPLHRPAAAPVIVQVVTAPAPSAAAPEAPILPPSSSVAPLAPIPSVSAASSGEAAVDLDTVLVDRAEAALREGQVERALAFAERHAAVFHGGGRRAHDRDVVRIAALLRAGRRDEARQRLATFAQAYPRSPRLDDFRRTLGDP